MPATLRETERGQFLCETCFDAMTNYRVTRDGLDQAQCLACRQEDVAHASMPEAEHGPLASTPTPSRQAILESYPMAAALLERLAREERLYVIAENHVNFLAVRHTIVSVLTKWCGENVARHIAIKPVTFQRLHGLGTRPMIFITELAVGYFRGSYHAWLVFLAMLHAAQAATVFMGSDSAWSTLEALAP